MAVGNLLGKKSKYIYVGDDGSNYTVRLLDAEAVEGTGAAAAAPAVFDPANPPANYAGTISRRRCRVVLAQDANGNRKEVVCTDPTANFYKTNLAKPIVIDTVTFNTTGRRGERFSF